jgi:hypothetical protein
VHLADVRNEIEDAALRDVAAAPVGVPPRHDRVVARGLEGLELLVRRLVGERRDALFLVQQDTSRPVGGASAQTDFADRAGLDAAALLGVFALGRLLRALARILEAAHDLEVDLTGRADDVAALLLPEYNLDVGDDILVVPDQTVRERDSSAAAVLVVGRHDVAGHLDERDPVVHLLLEEDEFAVRSVHPHPLLGFGVLGVSADEHVVRKVRGHGVSVGHVAVVHNSSKERSSWTAYGIE